MTKTKENAVNITADSKKYIKWAWLTLLSFGLMYLFFYNGRQNIGLVKELMAANLNITDGELGIVSSMLFWFYAFGQLINGRLGAFFGYKRFMIIGVLGSAVLNVLISFQTSVIVIAILWGLNGFFQSMVWANGIGVINNWWPKSKRGFATGLTTAFTGLAQVVTYLMVKMCLSLNSDWGWRSAFRLPIVPMVLSVVAFYFFFKVKPEDVGLEQIKEEAEPEKEDELAKTLKSKNYFYPYLLLFREPKVIILCVISAIAGVGRYALITWMPKYFSETMKLSAEDSILYSIFVPLGHACAMFLFPFITDKVFKGKREPMIIIAGILTIIGMSILPLIRVPMMASVMLFFVAVSSMVTGVIWAMAGDIGGKALSSTVVGVLDWAVYMGAAIQEMVFGYLKEVGWAAVFLTIGALYVILLVLTFVMKNVKTKRI